VAGAILGFATAITMIGPLLLDLSRELGVPLGQAGLLAAVMVAACGPAHRYLGIDLDLALIVFRYGFYVAAAAIDPTPYLSLSGSRG